MYIGRFLIIGPGVGAYRVSSRSFPNRQIVERGDIFSVVPSNDQADTDNPYVSYNCLRILSTSTSASKYGNYEFTVMGNGSHVDPIAEKIMLGVPPRDSVAMSLLTLDYERDEYNTPRIAGVAGVNDAVIGIVRETGLRVEAVHEPKLIATYEITDPKPVQFAVNSGDEAAKSVFDQSYEYPVCAIGAFVSDDGVDVAFVNEN